MILRGERQRRGGPRASRREERGGGAKPQRENGANLPRPQCRIIHGHFPPERMCGRPGPGPRMSVSISGTDGLQHPYIRVGGEPSLPGPTGTSLHPYPRPRSTPEEGSLPCFLTRRPLSCAVDFARCPAPASPSSSRSRAGPGVRLLPLRPRSRGRRRHGSDRGVPAP